MIEEIKKELEVLLYELEDTENKFGWLMVKDKIWQCFESKLKSEVEQAEIRGWNKCYRTYIEDNDDDTALTNKQEIDEYQQKVINAFERYIRSINMYAKDNWTVNQIVKYKEDVEYCKSIYIENRRKMNFDDAHDLARTKLFEKILKEVLLPESPKESE